MQHGIGPHLLRVAGEIDGLRRGIGAGTGNHRHALVGRLDAELDDVLVLFVAEGRALAGRADWNEPVRALRDLPLDQLLERLVVDFPAFEGRDQRRE